jgi:hypothetical protein
MTALSAVPKGNPQIMPHRCHLEQHEARTFRVYPEPAHTMEQVASPEYWAHMARQYRPGDILRLFWEDGSRFAEFLVLASDKTYIKVHCLSWHDLAGKAAKPDASFEVAWKGPVRKFCVIRASDGAFVSEGHATREDGNNWLEANRGNVT